MSWRTLCAAALLVACGDPSAQPQRYTLRLQAEQRDGSPLAGVRFWVAGRELGPTGDDGRASIVLAGQQGEPLQVSCLCPVRYRGPREPRSIRLQDLALTLRCELEQTAAVLVVRARQRDARLSVPVSVDGDVVGQTDADGVAHVLLQRPPGTSVQVRLDSSRLPRLVPRDPVRVFELEPDQSILLFDQWFEASPPTRTRARTRPDPPARPHVPHRIQ